MLTKRPERMAEYFATFEDQEGDLSGTDGGFRLGAAAAEMLDGAWIWGPGKPYRKKIDRFICDTHDEGDEDEGYEPQPVVWPLPNVWLGTSCEDQAAADKRIPELLRIPAAVRFLRLRAATGTDRTWFVCWKESWTRISQQKWSMHLQP